MTAERRIGFYFDSSACSGCKACQIACKDKNGLDVGLRWRRIVEVSGGGWTRSNRFVKNESYVYNVSVACMHCQKPICVEVCPTKAMAKGADGIVAIDPDRCIGCRYCEWACPYGAPQYDKASGTMTKCNMCSDYVAVGKAPACVSACQMRVLDYGDIELLRERYQHGDTIFPLPHPGLTDPAIVVDPHPAANSAGEVPVRIANREEI
jgi:anaerobic dimethyl sulfoxide reductase subunit B (iron-sulfur subunit)